LVYALPGEALARLLTSVRARLVAIPAALVLAILCAGLSRTAALEPPYVYGVFAAYLTRWDRGLDRRAKGGVVLVGALATLAVSLLAWALLEDFQRPSATRAETIAATSSPTAPSPSGLAHCAEGGAGTARFRPSIPDRPRRQRRGGCPSSSPRHPRAAAPRWPTLPTPPPEPTTRRGQPTSTANGTGDTTGYTWDLAGRLTTMGAP